MTYASKVWGVRYLRALSSLRIIDLNVFAHEAPEDIQINWFTVILYGSIFNGKNSQNQGCMIYMDSPYNSGETYKTSA